MAQRAQTYLVHSIDFAKARGGIFAGRLFGRLLLGSAAAALVAGAAVAQTESGQNGGGSIETVTVTAEKRPELLQNTPVPVSVLDSEALTSSNMNTLQDFYATVPGLNFSTLNRGESLLAIRGITTGGASNPTVGTVIDDVPYGASTSAGFGFITPSIDPHDLSSIEVLRGPQGTLYGASSMGGLIKYITRDPSTDEFSGRISAGTLAISNGDGVGYNFSGSANIPLSDTLAVRASAFTRLTPGYVDNPVQGVDGINKDTTSGGMFVALWKPSDHFSLKVDALLQSDRRDGSNDVNKQPGLGDLEQNELPGTGFLHQSTQFYTATMNADLGPAAVTSLTGYSVNSMSDRIALPAAISFTGADAALPESVRTKKFSEELRVDIPLGNTFDWLLGGFFTNEQTSFHQGASNVDPATGAFLPPVLFDGSFPFRYIEYAAFTDLTAHITDKFDIQAGIRESWQKQTFSQTETGALFGGGVFTLPQGTDRNTAFTYLFTPSYKVSSDLMIYARLASGFQPGGPNAIVTSTGFAPGYKPDTTKNYEIGAKGSLLNDTLTFDASLYYIDWKDLQITILDPAINNTVTANGGAAKSEGLEFSTLYQTPVPGLTVGGWVSLNNAVLTESFPATSTAFGADGDRLPYGSKVSGNLNADYEFSVGEDATANIGATLMYIGDRKGIFQVTAVRQDLPSYTQVNLRAGLTWSSWRVDAYLNNVGNTRGLLTGGLDQGDTTAFQYIQPLTGGITITKNF